MLQTTVDDCGRGQPLADSESGDRTMPKDLRQFINLLKEQYPEDIVEVSRPVGPHRFEVTAILEQLDKAKRYPVVHFKSPQNLLDEKSQFTLVSNVFGTRERCATALSFPREQAQMPLNLEFARRQPLQVKALTISAKEAPIKANVKLGESVDLRQLPIVRHFHMDISPVLTMACIMKDPDEGFYDITFAKTYYQGPRKLGTSIHTPHLAGIIAKYEARGQRAPIIIVLGHHPAFFLGAVALTPSGTNDYDAVGGYLDEPLRLVPSETWGEDFLVPADAEIIIEGEIIPEERVIVDPFGEVSRQYHAQCLRPPMEVTALTYRDNAIMQDIFSGHQEHWLLGAIPQEGRVCNALNNKFGGIKSLHLPNSGCGRITAYVSIGKTAGGSAKAIGMEVLTQVGTMQWVVVVDEEIDPFDESDVMWAVMTQTNPSNDITQIQNARTAFITAAGDMKVVIDATRPLDIAFPTKIKVPEDVVARMKLEEWIDGE